MRSFQSPGGRSLPLVAALLRLLLASYGLAKEMVEGGGSGRSGRSGLEDRLLKSSIKLHVLNRCFPASGGQGTTLLFLICFLLPPDLTTCNLHYFTLLYFSVLYTSYFKK